VAVGVRRHLNSRVAWSVLHYLERQTQTAVLSAVDAPARIEVPQRVQAWILGDRLAVLAADRETGGDLRRTQAAHDDVDMVLDVAGPGGKHEAEPALWTSKLPLTQGIHEDWRHRDRALTRQHVIGLPSFPASDKSKDPRYQWFCSNYGKRCWELDAMDPNDLRDSVETAIMDLIEPVAWKRCEVVNKAEQESLKTVLGKWGAP
jgi:hypothetical protein